MKKFLGIILLIFALIPLQKLNAQSSAGFIPGNIWYSIDPFKEGDKVRIYTMLFNPDSREFSGTVIFFDKATFLGKKDFVISPRSVKDVSIDWTATAGDHTIFAKIENAKFLISTGKYEEVYLSGNQSEESKRSVAKKITLDKENNPIKNIIDNNPVTIPDIGQIVEDNTPEIISTPIIASVNGIEAFRNETGNTLTKNKDNTKRSLDAKNSENDSTLLKPFKYVKLFFFSLFSLVFNNKIIFYGLFVFIIFLILRFLWRKIF